MNAHYLSMEVAHILQRLSLLPGSKTLVVQTKQYPRFLPAESGAGYQELFWQFSAHEAANDLALPSDAEDITITWKGVIQASGGREQISDSVAAALERSGNSGNWDYDVGTRLAAAAESELEARISLRH